MAFGDMRQSEQVSLVGAALTVVGAPLPWVSVSFVGASVSATGLDGDGVITLVLAAIAGVVLLARDWDEMDRIGVLALGGLVAVIGVFDLLGLPGAASPGIGLYVTIVGGIVLATGGWMGYSNLD